MADLVVGVDAGGTSTRCVVASDDGTVIGRGEAAGANQRSSDGDPVGALSDALRGSLSDLDPARVATGVFGIAGAGAAGHAAAQGMADSAWRSAGLPGRPTVVTDIAVAFAAGTPAPAGVVLVAGTGAVAAAIKDGEVVRRCDGYGWLLGDEGSAVWLGREAVRASLAAIDGRGQGTSLVSQVTRALLGENASPDGTPVDQQSPEALLQALIAVVYERSPAQLGLLAPLVGRAARGDDAVAARITDEAAARLLAAIDAVSPEAPEGSPTILTGSVIQDGPVADKLRAGLLERGAQPRTVMDTAVGAAVLALRQGNGGAALDDAVFGRLATADPRTR